MAVLSGEVTLMLYFLNLKRVTFGMVKVKGKVFPVLNIVPRHGDVLGERKHNSTHS
jgi:hypothetical protein